VANDGGSSNLEKSTSIKEGTKCCHLKKISIKKPKIIIGGNTIIQNNQRKNPTLCIHDH
jgi:hypothetical protein